MKRKLTLEIALLLVKNEKYTPLFSTISGYKTKLKVKCPQGHTTFIRLDRFKSGSRCTVCSGRRKLQLSEVQKRFTDIGYTPLFDVYINARTPLKFRCSVGHDTKIRLDNLKSGKRCNACSPSVKLSITEVKAVFTSKGYIPLFSEYTNSVTPLRFKCSAGHTHQISLSNLKSGQRCSKCVGGVKLTVDTVKEEFKRRDYTPLFLTYTNYHELLKFICDKGHKTSLKLSELKSGRNCRQCFPKKTISLTEAKECFTEVGYIPLFDAYTNNSIPLKFKCDKGHTHRMSLASIKLGKRCGKCSGFHKISLKGAQSEFTSRKYTPLFSVYDNNNTLLPFICSKGHTREITLGNLKQGKGCYICSLSASKPEKQMSEALQGYTSLQRNTRKIISPYELDIYFPEQKVAVEYCGLYWHNDNFKDRNYHYKKMKLCEEKGIRLITVFEDEFLERPDVVISRIKNSISVNDVKVFARKCKVREIDRSVSKPFLDKYHLQAASRGNIRFGLFFEEKLIGVMSGGSLSRPHVGKGKITLELKRLCFLPGYSVTGGASKLFKRFTSFAIDNGYTHIRSYQDMRYGNPWSPVYEKIGFTLLAETKYTPHYTKRQKRFRNQSLRKTPEERLTGKTEWELRKEQGYGRIWDCGHRTYELHL